MKKIKLAFIIVVVLSLQQFQLKAQAPSWSLENCISYALENNLTIKQYKLNVDLAKIDQEQSKYALLPSINANASNSKNYGLSVNPVTSASSYSSYNSFSTGINSQVTILGGGQKINNYKAQTFDLAAEQASFEKVKNDITLMVINYYLNVLYNQDLVAVSQEQLKISTQQFERANKNFEVGNITQGDLLESKAQLARDQLNLTNSENQLSIAKLNLLQLLDRDPAEQLQIQKPANILPNLNSGVQYQFADIYQTAEARLPDVKLYDFKYQSAAKSVSISKAALFPTLGFGMGLNSNYVSLARETFKGQLQDNFGQYWGFSLNVPIFNSRNANSNIKRAKINLANATINTQTARLNLSKSIAQALNDLKAAEKKYESTVKSNAALKESFKYNQQKFDVGLINAVDFIISKNNLSKSEAERVQALYELILRQKLVDFYLGNPLTF